MYPDMPGKDTQSTRYKNMEHTEKMAIFAASVRQASRAGRFVYMTLQTKTGLSIKQSIDIWLRTFLKWKCKTW